MRAPGLFDLQVNGFAGVDFNDAALDAASFERALEAMLATGVTGCLPTLITAHPEELVARFAALDRAVMGSALGRLMVPGYHLEGPFLNPREGYHGCHPPAAMTAPDARLVRDLAHRLKKPILMVTVAPEGEGGEAFIRDMVGDGRVVAIGHSSVDAAQTARAAEAGATLSTHLGNGLPQILPKLNNTLFAQLGEDRLTATFIADGIHLPPHSLKSLLRAKTLARSVLVTDAVSAAATVPGIYPLAGMQVEHAADGSVRVPGSASLAGSALTLDQAVRNVVGWGFCDAEEAMRLAGERPRALMAEAFCRCHIEVDAGEVEWSSALEVRRVKLGGREWRFGGASGLGHGGLGRLGA